MTQSVGVRWSPHWVLDELPDGTPVASAGPDRRLALRGIDAAATLRLRDWAADGLPPHLTDCEQRVADQLIQAGVLEPVATTGALHAIGAEPFTTKLLAALETTSDPTGFTLLVRTGTEWPEAPGRPHLAVDCSHHHTVVLGPYVVPGLTSCTDCLTTRLARRWPAVHAPPQPAVTSHVAIIAQLVAIQLDLIERGSSPLVNATIAWDLELGTTQRDTLLKSPGCPRCDRAAGSGRIELPWSARP